MTPDTSAEWDCDGLTPDALIACAEAFTLSNDPFAETIDPAGPFAPRFYVAPTALPEDVTQAISDEFNPMDPSTVPARDVETPYLNGKNWLFEALRDFQPRAARALLGSGGNLTVFVNRWKTHWHFDAAAVSRRAELLIECSGRLIRLYCRLRGNSIGNADDVGIWPPEALARSYYGRLDGWDVADDLVPSPFAAARLPGPVGPAWISFKRLIEEEFRLPPERQASIVSRYRTMWPECFPENWQREHLMQCFLDTRPHSRRREAAGDLILVRAFDPERRLYHIRDGDFESPRILVDPVAAIDRYAEHIFLWRRERFEFAEFSQPI